MTNAKFEAFEIYNEARKAYLNSLYSYKCTSEQRLELFAEMHTARALFEELSANSRF